MKKTILKSTKSVLIASAILASLMFGIYGSVTAEPGITNVASYPIQIENY